jgi:hypothetical protein
LSVRQHRGSELDRGASWCPCGATRGANTPWLRGYAHAAGSATQGPRQRAFGRVSSASGAGSARLHRRAPSAGIPTGAATGGSRAVGSVNAMLHGMRRRCDGSRRQVDIAMVRALNGWPTRRREFGQRGHESAEQGGLGEDGPDRWVPSVSNGGAVMSWQADSRAEIRRENGPQRFFLF